VLLLNIQAPAARVAELRRAGWPIRTLAAPHPRQDLHPGATMQSWALDAHFRNWIASTENYGRHPGDYPFADGRGKFGGWEAKDFTLGAKEPT
jgi:hypothetical protein